MQTTVEPLEGNRVKLHVAVPAEEFETAVNAAFRKLAGEVRIPGFRPGKAPRRILEARFGTEVAREQALKDGLPGFYADAVIAEDLDAIAPPEIEITAGEEDGDVEFDAVVEVRPVVNLTGYDSLTVELDFQAPDDESVNAQIEGLRERFGDLEESAEPLVDGNYAEMDISGSVDGEPVDALTATDFLYEIGSEGLVPKLDESLRGKRPGDIVEFDDVLPERFGDRAGQDVSFRVLVKDAKRKVLPELTDEWVSEVTEFETVDALRDDSRERISMVAKLQAQMALRDRVLDELAGLVPVEAPEALVQQDMEHRLHDLMHRLEAQGMDIPGYLAATGQDQSTFVDGIREGSVKAVLADLGLRAVVAQEEIEATDEELDKEIVRLAERMGQKPERVRRDLDKRGVLEAVRSDIARGKALEFLIDHAAVVDQAGDPIDLTLPDRNAGAEPAVATDPPTATDEAESPEVDSVQEEPQA
ncbi:MAG: trigger factor [Acidimicrobiia bacterium]